MPKLASRLTDAAACNARPKNRAYSLASGNGLSLEILPSGTKQWLLRYTLQDNARKKKVIALYPDVGVAAAHTLADELNPSCSKRSASTGVT